MKSKHTIYVLVMCCFLICTPLSYATITSTTASGANIGEFDYFYQLQNDYAFGADLYITSWIIPLFDSPDLSIVSESVVTPEDWTYEFLSANDSNWYYEPSSDPNAGTYDIDIDQKIMLISQATNCK